MEKWARKYDKCQNCRTIRFTHHGRGYCVQCYPVATYLEQVKCWDLSNPGTLKGYPNRELRLRPDIFEKVKQGYMSQLEARLRNFEVKEARLSDQINVKGMDLD